MNLGTQISRKNRTNCARIPSHASLLPSWQVHQRPMGDWVVDQFDRGTMRTRRYGPYDEAEARAIHADLTAPWDVVATDLGLQNP